MAFSAPLLANAFFVAAALSSTASAEDPARPGWTFVAGPGFGIEDGVRSTTGLGRMLFSYDDALAAQAWLDEGQPWGKAIGVVGRFTKLFFVDRPIVMLQGIVDHEVFGHGARAREAGLEPSYQFHLVEPYSWFLSSHKGAGGYTHGARSGVLERDIGVTIGGVEAEWWGAWWLTRDAVENGGWMSYHDMLQYFGAKLSYSGRLRHVLSQPPTLPNVWGDPDQYLSELQLRFNRWRPSDRNAMAQRLRYAYFYNFADPTLWQSIYHLAVTYLWEGKRDAKLLTIPLWDEATLYPTTRFNLSPFGAEHYLDLFFHHPAITVDAYARVGSSGLAAYHGGGAHLRGIRPGLGLTLGAEIDMWAQPELLFEQRFVFDRPNAFGMSAGLHVDWHIYDRLAVTGKIAGKTRGYLMGQPLEGGAYGYAGLTITPDAEGALFNGAGR